MNSVIPSDQVDFLIDELTEAKEREEFNSISSKFNEIFISRYKAKYPYPSGRFPFGSAGPAPAMDNYNKVLPPPPPPAQYNIPRSMSPMRSQFSQPYADPYANQIQNPPIRQSYADPYLAQAQNLPMRQSYSDSYAFQSQGLPLRQQSQSIYGYQAAMNEKIQSYYQDRNSQFYESYNPYNNPPMDFGMRNQQISTPQPIYDYSPNITKEMHPKAIDPNYKSNQRKVDPLDFSSWTSIRRQKEAELASFHK
ncbi:unnamed protein product [Blepharisma stoltei]|uniref:Uncharacterized protein n=1 Tax=Blepharisma stoltei TaxID=1481888 RepID=A0AAU9JZV2_9CILI|nr:unnamed protein product [Blepharisma stoltei]